MDYTIIDAHAHLWLRQDTVVDGLPIRTLENGRSEFMGEIRQMVPPFMIDGVNSAEVFLSNMDYAQVAAAVITQEFIDGIQNDYLSEVVFHYPNRFFVSPESPDMFKGWPWGASGLNWQIIRYASGEPSFIEY